MQIDQIMGPAIPPLRGLIQIGKLLKVLPLVGQQGIIETQDPFGF
jgi:hypothetical protein